MIEADKSIREFWQDSLVSIQLDSAYQHILPDNSQHFLATIGLPLSEKLSDASLKRYGFDTNHIQIITFRRQTYLQLWRIEAERLGIWAYTGLVFLLNSSRPPPPIDGRQLFQAVQLVNSSIEAYLLCLTHYLMSLPRRRELFGANLNPQGDLSPEEVETQRMSYFNEHETIMATLADQLRRIDPVAMQNDKYYWVQKLARESAMFYV